METNPKPVLLGRLLVASIATGAALGWVLFLFGTLPLIGTTTKALAVLIGSAWVGLITFATKISDITESPSLTPEEHNRLEYKCQNAVRRIWVLSTINAISVLIVLMPSALVDSKIAVYEWMLVVAGAAAGFSVYSIAFTAFLQEELRTFRSNLRLRERENARLAEQKKLMAEPVSANHGTVVSDVAKYNQSFDWPTDPPSVPH